MVAIDLVEGGGRGVGQLSGGKADDGSILLMKLEHFIVNISPDLLNDFGDVGTAVEYRSRKTSQWVEVYIVYELTKYRRDDLL